MITAKLNTTQVLLLALVALASAWAATDIYLRVDREHRIAHEKAMADYIRSGKGRLGEQPQPQYRLEYDKNRNPVWVIQ